MGSDVSSIKEELEASPPAPQNVNVFGDGVLTEVIELK